MTSQHFATNEFMLELNYKSCYMHYFKNILTDADIPVCGLPDPGRLSSPEAENKNNNN